MVEVCSSPPPIAMTGVAIGYAGPRRIRFSTGPRRIYNSNVRMLRLGVRATPVRGARAYNFASLKYANCFKTPVPVDTAPLRAATVELLDQFDAELWTKKPVRTLINGATVEDSLATEQDTVDAFGQVNGKILLSSQDVVARVIEHVATYKPQSKDLRKQVREIEQKLLETQVAAQLVANQAMDFGKQDGITEIEESIQANPIEQRLNDLLFEDEEKGVVEIGRNPAFVGCVSNFSNFLDLFRKTLRNLELGVPVVIFSRSNTTQYMYRWAEILIAMLKDAGIDQGMVTYASCGIEEQRQIISRFPNSPMYLTGSRPVAKAIKGISPKLMASTGGPNTMVATSLDGGIPEAVKLSACIENSGQCTALRHLVVPDISEEKIKEMFSGVEVLDSARDALSGNKFSGVLKASKLSMEQGYSAHETSPMAYRSSDELPEGIVEHWRQVYVDITKAGKKIQSPEYIKEVSDWLNTNQPISLVVNGNDVEQASEIMIRLFETTSLVVYSLGTVDNPALTAQARPQDAEVFGEFPPRRQLTEYTKFPVIVPSSTPGYNSHYSHAFLAKKAKKEVDLAVAQPLLDALSDPSVLGYSKLLIEFLQDSCGANLGFGERTSLWGIQRPPLIEAKTVIRCPEGCSMDDIVPYLLPFYITNAHEQVELSSATALSVSGIEAVVESDEELASRTAWNVITATPIKEFSLVGHFVSLLFPYGHIKSTENADSYFVKVFTQSKKWLAIRSTAEDEAPVEEE